ncbi:unnamed protein product [Lactuca virosa]|uniref:Uncharacterized protein n=1 Tax=Lactuca virosa TaxID=75947 RepID=A0AAU9NRN0_9ASTR|nr:unnamed protein product [Lactuca virosa]
MPASHSWLAISERIRARSKYIPFYLVDPPFISLLREVCFVVFTHCPSRSGRPWIVCSCVGRDIMYGILRVRHY